MSKYSDLNGIQDELMDMLDNQAPMDHSDAPVESVSILYAQCLIDQDIEAMKRRVKEMEQEVNRLKSLQSELDKDSEAPSTEEGRDFTLIG